MRVFWGFACQSQNRPEGLGSYVLTSVFPIPSDLSRLALSVFFRLRTMDLMRQSFYTLSYSPIRNRYF